MNLRYVNFVVTLALLFLIFYILFIGRGMLLPLVIALVFWYIIIHLTSLYQRISVKKRHFPFWISLIMAIITTGLILYLLSLLIEHSIANIVALVPKYQQKLQEVFNYFNRIIGDDKININRLIAQI